MIAKKTNKLNEKELGIQNEFLWYNIVLSTQFIAKVANKS